MTDMTPGEWAAVVTCVVLLVLTAWGAGKWTQRRKEEGRR